MTEIEEEAARWFAALDRGVMTLEERDAYEKWHRDPLNSAAIARLRRVWQRFEIIREYGTARVPGVAGERRPLASLVAVLLVAAAISLPAATLTNGTWWTTLDWWSR